MVRKREPDLVLILTLSVLTLGVSLLKFPSPVLANDATREAERLIKRGEELKRELAEEEKSKREIVEDWRRNGSQLPVTPSWERFDSADRDRFLEELKNSFRGGRAPAPTPKPSPKPKPEYGPFPEGDPRNNPAPKKSPPPPGVGPYGPEPLPAEDPNQLRAKAPLQFDGLLGRWGANQGTGNQLLGHAFKQDSSANSASALKADCNQS